MIYVWLTTLVIFNSCSLLLVLFSLPGNWLIVSATGLFAWWKWDEGIFSIYTLIAITVLAVIGEIIEFFAGAGGAKKAGASWLASLSAIAGALIGAMIGTVFIPVPILGTLLGACIGAGTATLAVEALSGKKIDHSIKSGLGAGVGVFLGTTSKFVIGILIWLTVTVAAFYG
ncbi:MAG: DUF456 domain-containing protein [Phycisphaerae bacterium]|nr:DUF456 domain-containing protein [Phycisphaerae bacterium]